MASSSSWKLFVLMKKNLLIIKRNPLSIIFEIFFPIIVLLVCYLIRLSFKLEKYYFYKEEIDEPTFLKKHPLYITAIICLLV